MELDITDGIEHHLERDGAGYEGGHQHLPAEVLPG
jgi:hypothetical protein